MASEKAKELARKQKEQIRAEKLRKKNSDDPKDWGRWRQFTEAYKRTNEIDPSTRWWMLGVAVGVIVVIAAIGLLTNLAWWAWVPLALMSALLGAMLVLTRKARTAMITRYAGQPGSAEVALQMLNKRRYSYDLGIAATRELDLVHRVLGPGGIVLIGEGAPGRTRKLLSEQERRHGQVSYGTAVTTLMIGDAPNQVKLGDLQKRIEKMPKVLAPFQVTEVQSRLKALHLRNQMPIPKGPMPTPKGMNRAMRGR
ncbi:DUF4191 domain-containing protein [Propioniciclava soli]|uniref:DUF4191 domain-containing protein n=1 Tax=Propioniciclava soli TaxID=2775081 RepID=A0ABZ3C4V9_9ACTN|nr:DUF4191 domain-containing protein [Propioniciclava soli]